MPPDSLWRSWTAVAASRGRKIAMIDAVSGETRTFQRLSGEAETLAGRIFAPAAGSLVACAAPNSFSWMTVFLGLQAAGAGILPLDPGTPAPRRHELAHALGASFFWDGARLSPLGPRKKRTLAACVKMTSGSTGMPRALPCRAAHLLTDGKNILETMGIRRTDRNLGLIPFGHSYGLGNLVLPLILQGTVLAFAAEFVPAQILQWISRYRVTVFPSVPAVFRILAQSPGRRSLRPLRTAISAGAPLDQETADCFRARFGVKLHNFYGSSETGGICYDCQGIAAGRSVGRPLKNVRVRVLRGGRVEVRSGAVVLRGGRYVLPDLGRWNGRGELCLLGRAGAAANIGGRKVLPAEVENVLRCVPKAGEARVMVLHNQGRDYLVAFVEAACSRAAEFEMALRDALPAWKLPRRLIVRDRLPRNARGKLDVEALKRLADSSAIK